MIRPLIYCETQAHFESSIDTIDTRIQELFALRKQYLAAQQAMKSVSDLKFEQEERFTPGETVDNRIHLA